MYKPCEFGFFLGGGEGRWAKLLLAITEIVKMKKCQSQMRSPSTLPLPRSNKIKSVNYCTLYRSSQSKHGAVKLNVKHAHTHAHTEGEDEF